MSSKKPTSIKKDYVLPDSMNYTFLKKKGIEHSQELAGKIWTDYNEHDPGITILENICYTLTELGYKTNFNIKDILYGESDEKVEDILYQIQDIFPCSPVTILDYRKLVIDRVNNINNAWIVPKRQSQLGININGLYDVLLQIKNFQYEEETVQIVHSLLNQNRNLCEDFDSIQVLESEKIIIAAEVIINPDVVGESLLANMLYVLSDILQPEIAFYTLEEMLDKGYDYSDIFSGPAPKNGFIEEGDLIRSDMNNISKIFRSQLIQRLTELEGVQAIADFSVLVGGVEQKEEYIKLDGNRFPVLDIEEMLSETNPQIIFYVGDIVYELDMNVVQYSYDMLKVKSRQSHKRWLALPEVDKKSNRSLTEMEEYFSMQNTFPKTYGITSFGIGKTNITERQRAQVKQLKAYLLPFEQIMANHLSQLVNTRRLFSIEEEMDITYFGQNIESIVPNAESLFLNGQTPKDKGLHQIIKKYDKNLERRNRFLDHLLARFGEEFMEEAFNAIHRDATTNTKEDFNKKAISAKIKFLKNYINISQNKAKGFDYSETVSDPENTAGLKKKICLLFNIEEYGHKQYAKTFTTNKLKVKETKKAKDKPQKGVFSFKSNSKNILAEVLAFGMDRNNYIIAREKKNDKVFNISFINPKSKREVIISQIESLEKGEDALDNLIVYLKNLNKSSEGFHLIENILLRLQENVYRFRLTDKSTELFSSDFNYSDNKKERKNLLNQLLLLGKDAKKYKIGKKEEQIVLELLDEKNQPFIKKAFGKSKKNAQDFQNKCIDFFQSLVSNKQDINEFVIWEQKNKEGAIMVNDPYSLQISIVIPAWAARFRTRKMKILFENIVKLNAPAHLTIRFYWYDIPTMAKFEGFYEKWLNERRKLNPDFATLDDLSVKILKMLVE